MILTSLTPPLDVLDALSTGELVPTRTALGLGWDKPWWAAEFRCGPRSTYILSAGCAGMELFRARHQSTLDHLAAIYRAQVFVIETAIDLPDFVVRDFYEKRRRAA